LQSSLYIEAIQAKNSCRVSETNTLDPLADPLYK